MSHFYQLLFYFHVTAGVMAIILFWVPIFALKGGEQHKRFGRYYRRLMYVVAACGIAMSALMLAVPTAVKPNLLNANDLQAVLNNVRFFALLLLFLGYITFFTVYNGQLVLQAKQSRALFRTPLFLTLTGILAVLSVLITYFGWQASHPLLLIFGALGLFGTFSTLHFVFKREVSRKKWLTEHLGNYIGSGIAAYTAFITFGARHLISLPGNWQILFWVLPGVIGAIFITYLTRKYDPKATANKVTS
ncbi:hypothetical protein [Pseudidiomarina sp.]|uniref:hypothetical protein n=1 Tax=Pseudidiomarina sp. TaxID=2081707 RepID=UPI003A986BC1